MDEVEKLREEIRQLREDQEETYQLNNRLAFLLTGTANALKGDPGSLQRHDWSDLPKVAAAAVAERDAARELREKFAALAAVEEYIGESCRNASHNIRAVLSGEDDPRPAADRWELEYRQVRD